MVGVLRTFMSRFARFGQVVRAVAATGICAVAFVCAPKPGSTQPTHAIEKAPASTSQTACGGVNMLNELAVAEPDVYRHIRNAANSTSNANAALWKVERPGRPASYLLGTIHMTDPRVTAFSPKLKSVIAEVETIALEVADLSAAATNAAITKKSRLVIYADGHSLHDHLSQKEFDKVKKTLNSAGLPGNKAGMFRPWVVSMILSISTCERQQVQAGQQVLDMKLANAALKRGITVVGLETIESQLSAMAAIPDDQQIAMLRASLKFADRANDTNETLLQLYASRDMGAAWPFHLALAKKAGIDANAFKQFQASIVYERNEKMHDAALPLLEKGRALVAVGALHLIGDRGLVNLLRKSGYTLTPIE
ncbi:MAG: TraB/GumN family protein [Hyphomicrobiaceae bacterium]